MNKQFFEELIKSNGTRIAARIQERVTEDGKKLYRYPYKLSTNKNYYDFVKEEFQFTLPLTDNNYVLLLNVIYNERFYWKKNAQIYIEKQGATQETLDKFVNFLTKVYNYMTEERRLFYMLTKEKYSQYINQVYGERLHVREIKDCIMEDMKEHNNVQEWQDLLAYLGKYVETVPRKGGEDDLDSLYDDLEPPLKELDKMEEG